MPAEPTRQRCEVFFQGIAAIESSCVRQNADGERPKTRILANAATKMLHSVAYQERAVAGLGATHALTD